MHEIIPERRIFACHLDSPI